MIAKFKDPILFKKIIDVLCILVDEIHIRCNGTGLTIRGMEDKHIAMVSVDLNNNFFETFTCTSDVDIGVCLHSIQQILKYVDKSMPLYIKIDEQQTLLDFMADYEDNRLYLSINLTNNESDSLNIPEHEYDAKITMLANDFHKIITNLNQNWMNVRMSMKKNIFVLTPDKNADSQITINPNQSKEIKYNFISTNESSFDLDFSLRYLAFFTKAHTLSNSVNIKLSKNFPMCVEYNFYYNSCSIKYYLAPICDDSNESDDSDKNAEELIKSVFNICKIAYHYFTKS